jgi:ATP-dependent exoDNAse (exonuclease V) alpha subunit
VKIEGQQRACLDGIGPWMNSPGGPQVKKIFGYAGTGKTTLAKYLRQLAKKRWLFAAYTGKAAHVLRQKGCEGAATIHSLIYRPAGESKAGELLIIERRINDIVYNDKRPEGEPMTADEVREVERLQGIRTKLMVDNQPRFALWDLSQLAEPDVGGIIVDEVSMVDRDLARDLESFGKKILVLGDPAQLPPVGSGGYYTSSEPDYMLTEVHRQAKESGILQLATLVREGARAEPGSYGNDCEVLRRSDVARENVARIILSADQVLCGMNKTRHAMNRRHRELMGRDSQTPLETDRLVCLKNYRTHGLFNGSQWTVVRTSSVDIGSMTGDLTLSSDDGIAVEPQTFPCWLHHMLGRSEELETMGFDRRDFCEFDWSYALTVHKAQGSQWPNVAVWDESGAFRSGQQKWLYTAVTRASSRLTVFV